MKHKPTSLGAGVRRILPAYLGIVFCTVSLAVLLGTKGRGERTTASSTPGLASDAWTNAEIIKPADLVKEMAEVKGVNRPIVVCTGYRTLFKGAHVPEAVFHGPASKPEGLSDLKDWAKGIPRSANIVIYCGCCSFDHCPNIRPTFETLRSMGFQHLRVLVLPNNFAKDWVEQGYAVEKGS